MNVNSSCVSSLFMLRTLHEGSVQVGTKVVRKSTMSKAVANADLTKELARSLVDHAGRECGSRMTAYKDVAAAVGTSAMWLRRFIHGYTDVKEPGWTVGWNIIDHYKKVYDRACERVEQEIETERTKKLALKERTDAVTQAMAGIEKGTPRTHLRGETSAIAD